MKMRIILLRSVTFETEKVSEIIIKYKMKNSMKNMNLLSALLMGGARDCNIYLILIFKYLKS